MSYRVATDSMGDVPVPSWAYYGAQTQRAVNNFSLSDLVIPAQMIRALAIVKWAAAKSNESLGLLDPEISQHIQQAADQIVSGDIGMEHFPLDVFQTGSATSTNMNMNEVIAYVASQSIGNRDGSQQAVHPNDHVNKGQSSNDTIPTSIHIAAALAIKEETIPELKRLQSSLEQKADEFYHIIKIGRTHLQDATPIRLGQSFSGFARQIELGISRLEKSLEDLYELALGGTAVGTGLNTHKDFASRAIASIAERLQLPFVEATNHFEAQASKDALVFTSGALKTIMTSMMKIANDIRWLASGPRCGLGEISIPELQPGSSIMPGKVNPVIPEAVIQAAAHVAGNDLSITIGGQWGNLELNVMMPMMAHNLIESITLTARSAKAFSELCVEGIEANADRCESYIEESLAMVTSLAPVLGYDRAASIAQEAYSTGKTVRQTVSEMDILPADELETLLDPERMTRPSESEQSNQS